MTSRATSASSAEAGTLRVLPQVKHVLAISGPYSYYLYGSVVLGVIHSFMIVAAADVSARMLDAMLGRDLPVFLRMAWIAIAVATAQPVVAACRRLLSGRYGQGSSSILRTRLAARLTRSTAEAASAEHSGQVLSKLTNDLREVQSLTETEVPEALTGTVRAVLAMAYMLWRNWLLALIAVFAAPAVFAIVGRLNAPVMGVSKETQEALGRANQVATESLAGAETVRAFGLQERLYESFRSHTDVWLKLSGRMARIQAAVAALGFGASFTPFILVIGIGGVMAVRGRIGMGPLMAFVELMNHVAFPMQNLPRLLTQISTEAASAKRVLDLLDTPVEREDGSDFGPDPSKPAFEFRDVTFRYPGAPAPALAGLSFTARVGETIALAGSSGSGKTTVARLLLGDYAAESGEVLVFGHPVSEWSLPALRRRFSYVSQNTYLFPFTVEENLRLDHPGVSDSELREAASIAMASEFIESLPQGYATPVGEVGSRISGGERQRLSLARAIARRSDVLLLDEATSALDYRSERQVIDGLRERLAGVTTLVIAHRLSSVQHADRIMVLSDGRVTESGTHTELLELGGKYHQLYSVQQEGGDPR